MYNPPPTPEECKSVVDSTDLQFWLDLAETISCKQCRGTNYLVECKCGCGEIISGTSDRDRSHRFKTGHGTRGKHLNYKPRKRGRKRTEEAKQKARVSMLAKKGGRVMRHGYIFISKWDHPQCDSTGYVREHRLVYEESHNCCLLKWVDIHHRDGNKSNNVWYNLIPYSHGGHTKLEMTKDMSDRICLLYNNHIPYRRRWLKYENGFVCQNCYKKQWKKKHKQIMLL